MQTLDDLFSLRGKVALITGASAGLGVELARVDAPARAEHGARGGHDLRDQAPDVRGEFGRIERGRVDRGADGAARVVRAGRFLGGIVSFSYAGGHYLLCAK